MPIVGSFAGASARAYGLGAGVALPGDFISIATTTVGSGGVASVDFTSIPQTYTHLQIRSIARSTSANSDDNFHIRFNSDSSSNYSLHYVSGNGTSAISGANATDSLVIAFRGTGNLSTANIFGTGVVDILDYTNTNKYKTTRSLTGHDQNGSGSVWFFSGHWRSTSAITSISLFSSSNIAQYSSFALYGVKA
jgi:hypothetical protein